MDAKKVELSGRVSRGAVDVGSKSERNAVTLKTDEGATYVLRKDGAPAFGDNSFDALVGGRFTMTGVAIGDLLVVKEWRRD